MTAWPADATPSDFPCGLLVIGADDRLQAVNAGLCRLTGRAEADLVGQPMPALFTPAGQLLYQTLALPKLALGAAVDELVLPVRRASGQPLDMLLYASPAQGSARTLTHAVLAPCAARREAEGDLRRLRRAADRAPGMLFHFVQAPGLPGRFLHVSEAVRVLYGCAPAAALANARLVLDRLHAEDLRALRAAIADDEAAADQPRAMLLRVARDAGAPAWHEVHASTWRALDGALHWFGHVADMTRRRQMEQEAVHAHAAEQVRAAQTAFLARLSHELRTPLNAIIGFSQLLARPGADRLSGEQARHVDLIRQSGHQLLHLVNEVLDIARLQSAEFTVTLAPTPAHQTLSRCMALAEPAAQDAGVRLVPPAGAHWPMVLADERRLEQVLGNLIGNAVKYNRPGGTVQARLRVQAGMLWIDIQDTGPGLGPAQLSQLFQPFNRLGAEARGTAGTGLGLVIKRQLVERMGGELAVRSEPGQGACFSVGLAQCAALPGRPTATPAARVPDGAGAASVLYVEDNPVNAELMRALFAFWPERRLEVAGTGAQALNMAPQVAPALLLIDRQLPDTDGHALLHALRAVPGLAQVPAVMVSAEASETAWRNAVASGFVDYWPKPLQIAQVMQDIDRLLGAPRSPAGA